jgi:hypothetical protein
LKSTGTSDAVPLPESLQLDLRLCQVGGLNHNYVSSSGTLYHIQIEDRGPVLDRGTERQVRRVNVVIYANYGEPNAQVVHSHDHDLEDLRTNEHNRQVQQRIQELAGEARSLIEEREQREVLRIKCLIREYHFTKHEGAKRGFEEANAAFPFLFSRAWREMKEDRQRASSASASALGNEVTLSTATPTPSAPVTPVDAPALTPETSSEVVYPLDRELRDLVLDIERIVIELGRDLQRLREQGEADDIVLQTCRKLVTRAKESLYGRRPSDFSARRLEVTRNSLMTTWRQVRSRLKS